MQFRRIVVTLATLAVAAVVTAVILRSQPGPISAAGGAPVTAGGNHTCALTTTGGVQCWGLNAFGQLGDGTIVGGPTPVDVSGLSGVAAVSAGYFHSCALTTGGGVKCWGSNRGGQLGAETTESCAPSGAPIHLCSTVPVDVTGLGSGVAAVSAGGALAFAHTCAVTTTGAVKCWGTNGSGQLGDGTTADSGTPVAVSGLTSGVAAVSAGLLHTCALMTTGGVECWGLNDQGQLGDGTTNTSSTPVEVSGLTSGVAAVSAGSDHTCARTTSGAVKCWGSNEGNRLGAETTEDCDPDPEDVGACSTVPVAATGLGSGVAAVAAGGQHTCAVITTGGVKCWGRNDIGQLGNGTSDTGGHPPEGVVGLPAGVVAVVAGAIHTCVATTTAGVLCWGFNVFGELGATTTETCLNTPCSTTPLDVIGLGLGTKPTPCPTGKVPVGNGCGTPTVTPAHTPTPCPTAKVPVGNGCGTPTPTPTPKDPDGDTDGDTIPNGSDPDDDNDGCTDVKELEPKALAAAGGGRDPHNFWDFFDTWTIQADGSLAKDHRVDGFDIGGVVARFGAVRGTPPTKGEALAEALTPPVDSTSYHSAFDRDSPDPEANVWNLRPPNGFIDGFDISFVVFQFGHSCVVLPLP